MRIAYVTPYQGPTLLKRRPIVRNRSMSNRIKIELIATLLHTHGHDVELISQGEVVEHRCTFYPAFSESELFHPRIPIDYASALPIRRLNGLWSSLRTLQLLTARHRVAPYDIVIIFNLKDPQITCAHHAIRRLKLPVVLEYEDDRFVNVGGARIRGLMPRYRHGSCLRLFQRLSGCVAVSPHLLSQVPAHMPKLLLRGLVGDDIRTASEPPSRKRDWVLFSGTHVRSNGVAELIEAWRIAALRDWELHITGYGEMTDQLRAAAAAVPGVVFHGLVSRPELVELMTAAKICINPHAVSQSPGNVFAFKIIEYLAAGAHCITTPMGTLEPSLEAGITYMPDNSPETIATTLQQVIASARYHDGAARATLATYGPEAVSSSLDNFLKQVMKEAAKAGAPSYSDVRFSS